MLYHYVASDKEGKLVEGEYDSDTIEGVLRHLSSEKLTPISVKPLRTDHGTFSFHRRGKITLTDKLFLVKYLSLMLGVGTDLLSAINILIADFEKPAMRNFLLEIRDSLTHGNPFYEAFAKYPKVFSTVFINLIKAAEASGNLEQTFGDLSLSLQKDSELRSKIKSALIYPLLILIGSLSVFIFLTTFALPKIANVFLQGGIEPPAFSKFVFTFGLFMGENVFIVLPVSIAVITAVLYFFVKTLGGRRLGRRIASHLPLVGKVQREISLQRFASTYSALLKAGIPIVDTTKITADVVGSEDFRMALMTIAEEGLSKGLTIGEAFRREEVFPRVVSNLISISEKAGHIEEVLGTLADFYASSIDTGIKTLVSFLEPIMLLAMGAIVGTIALSIIVPIYQLTGQF